MRTRYVHTEIFARYTSFDFQAIGDDGSIITRAAILSAHHPANTLGWVGRPSVKLLGDTAIVRGAAIEREVFSGGTIVGHYYRMEIYAKHNGAWLAEASQISDLQTNTATEIAHPPTRLTPFVGRYLWAPGKIETVRVVRSHLTSTLDGETSRLFFVGPETTAISDDLGTSTYVRDARGDVVAEIYRRCDGQTLRNRKLPDP